VIPQDGKGRFNCETEGMIRPQYLSSGGCPKANVVEKHSISSELAQKLQG
jgi:hypothetical protein